MEDSWLTRLAKAAFTVAVYILTAIIGGVLVLNATAPDSMQPYSEIAWVVASIVIPPALAVAEKAKPDRLWSRWLTPLIYEFGLIILIVPLVAVTSAAYLAWPSPTRLGSFTLLTINSAALGFLAVLVTAYIRSCLRRRIAAEFLGITVQWKGEFPQYPQSVGWRRMLELPIRPSFKDVWSRDVINGVFDIEITSRTTGLAPVLRTVCFLIDHAATTASVYSRS
jgi:hypothetical protein